MMNRRYPVFLGAAIAVCLLASGCTQGAQSDLGRTVDSSKEQLKQDEQTQVAHLKDNTNLPPKAREAALRQRELAKKGALMAHGQPGQ